MTQGVHQSLGTALPAEMARVRDEVLPAYLEVGPAGALAATLIRADLDVAASALSSGDVVQMVRVYQRLRETTT